MSIVKTGYFYQAGKDKGLNFISIAVGNPRFLKTPVKMAKLAPTWALLKAYRADEIDDEGYIDAFNKQLEKMDAKEVIKEIESTEWEENILMCHCNQSSFCHRHLVAEWLERKLGIEIHEHLAGKVVRSKGRIVSHG